MGERGIRTLGTYDLYNGLAIRRFRPLGHLSKQLGLSLRSILTRSWIVSLYLQFTTPIRFVEGMALPACILLDSTESNSELLLSKNFKFLFSASPLLFLRRKVRKLNS